MRVIDGGKVPGLRGSAALAWLFWGDTSFLVFSFADFSSPSRKWFSGVVYVMTVRRDYSEGGSGMLFQRGIGIFDGDDIWIRDVFDIHLAGGVFHCEDTPCDQIC